MTTGRDGSEDGPDEGAPATLVDALLVYAEPLASGAHAVVVGDAESSVAERLLELGARAVHVFDPDAMRAARASRSAPRGVTVRSFVDDLDVRDGAFDLAVVPDLADLHDPRRAIARLRRAVVPSGAVVAMGRARIAEDANVDVPFGADLGPAALGYAELYDLFAVQFDDVSLVGVLPFKGVVFAQLGTEDEAPSVSVDTRLASPAPPSVFVVVASTAQREASEDRPALDPYAIVQVPEQEEGPPEATLALQAGLAAAQLKAEVLSAKLDEARDGIVVADVRSVEIAARLDRASAERDAALTRAMELEAVLAGAQQTLATLERRLLDAERGMLDRDDQLATLSAELDARHSAQMTAAQEDLVDIAALVARAERAEAALALALVNLSQREEDAANQAETDVADIEELVARAERAEADLALNVADLAHVAEAHAAETASYEEQLRDRAQVVAELERELARREQLVKELVASLEESRDATANGVVFESAVPLAAPAPRPEPALVAEAARLRAKLDELAAEVARREGELTARAWRITELENERTRLLEGVKGVEVGAPGSEPTAGDAGTGTEASGEAELARARDELDALRQALAQEHASRIAAESGEELARARSELAQQAALLEQLRARGQA